MNEESGLCTRIYEKKSRGVSQKGNFSEIPLPKIFPSTKFFFYFFKKYKKKFLGEKKLAKGGPTGADGRTSHQDTQFFLLSGARTFACLA